jgi:uroporphyrinogen decarboxylase
MIEMTPRQRVRLALSHQEPDRVPIALGGGPYGIVDDLYFKLLTLLNLGAPVQPFRTGHNISYLDDRLFKRLGIDTRYVWPGSSPSNPAAATSEPDVFLDGYGQPWKRALPYYYATEGILAKASIDQIDQIVHWPDPHEPQWIVGVQERASFLKQETDNFVIARMVTSHGPYMTACNLRGTERYLLDMAEDPEFAQALIDRVTESIDGLLKSYLHACGGYIDMMELPGDDYASNVNLIISPNMFRRYIKPALSRLVSTIKGYRSDIIVMLHSDGLIEKLLPEFVEIGIEVVHPLEPVPAMDQVRVKNTFGDKLSFLGTIDIAHAMTGDQAAVVEEVKLRLKQFASGGGYVLAPANHLQADVPPENVITLFEAARKYGRYPITLP